MSIQKHTIKSILVKVMLNNFRNMSEIALKKVNEFLLHTRKTFK